MKPRVLIVDDEKNMCQTLGTALDRRGFDPVWRLSAEAGWQVLAESPVDLVLTDIQIDLPPLRARGSDVLLLAARSGKSVESISKPAAKRLLAYFLARQRARIAQCHRAVRRTHTL